MISCKKLYRESGAQVMGLCTFKGGVHPYDGKDLSKDKPIQEYLPKGDLVYPLSQHIGAPAKPVVAVGDAVLKGQMIAEAGGFVSAPIYATVSGTVKAIEPRRVAVGDMVNSIVVENDGEFKSLEFTPVDDVASLSKEEIIKKIQNAGIVGMGGAGFPTHVKLSPKEPEKIDYIIANCAECEPYLTSDYRRMIEEPEKLIEGMRIILSLFDNAKGLFGVEDNKPDCIEKLKEKIEKIIQDIIKNTEDVLYPPACPICGKPRVVKNKERLDICPWCLDKITYVDEPTCIKCGKALDDDSEYCQDCMKTEHIYDQAVSLYEYSDGIKESIYIFIIDGNSHTA